MITLLLNFVKILLFLLELSEDTRSKNHSQYKNKTSKPKKPYFKIRKFYNLTHILWFAKGILFNLTTYKNLKLFLVLHGIDSTL
jgi:hypothetical protein